MTRLGGKAALSHSHAARPPGATAQSVPTACSHLPFCHVSKEGNWQQPLALGSAPLPRLRGWSERWPFSGAILANVQVA